MTTYVILLRGINVGGKNKISMAALKHFLEEQGFSHVVTYIQSGNVILQSDLDAAAIRQSIESGLPRAFQLDSAIISVLVLTHTQLQHIIDHKPTGFGEQPDTFHSDAIFLIDIDAAEALSVFTPRARVDAVWAGEGVIYSQRLSAQRTKSRLGKIVGTPAYQSMTIRNWNTTTKLLELAQTVETASQDP